MSKYYSCLIDESQSLRHILTKTIPSEKLGAFTQMLYRLVYTPL
jgi:hypothetical protein